MPQDLPEPPDRRRVASEAGTGSTTPGPRWDEVHGAEHVVRFYESVGSLVETGAAFLEAAVRDGAGLLIVAPPDRVERFRRALEARDVDLDDARDRGRCVVLHAGETLDEVGADGDVDRERFQEVLGGAVARLSGEWPRVRVFSELVTREAAPERRSLAVRVDRRWQDLLLETPITLLCAYDIALFGGEDADADFAEVCSEHTRVLPAESYSGMDTRDQGQAIAGLQRRGAALDAEVVRRKETEQDSALLTAIVESSDDAIVSKDLDGIITSWNRGAERMFGYAAEETIGRPITLIVPKDREGEEPQILARIRRGERVDHFETVRRRKDGALLDISLTISPVYDREGRVVGASKIARDITKRRETERELREAEARYGRLAELLPVGVFSVDAENGAVQYFNQHTARLWGRTPTAGTTYEEIFRSLRLFHPDGETRLTYEHSPVALALRDGLSFRNEEIVVERADGRRVTVLVNVDVARGEDGAIERAIVVFNDVSALRHVESALEEQRADLQVVLETVPVAVFLAHDSDGRVITGNRAAAELLRMPVGSNLSAGPPAGQDTPPFQPRRDGEPVDPSELPIQRAARGETVLGEELEIRFADGVTLHTMVSARPLYDEAGRPRGAVGSIMDVTELKQTESALREADRLKDEFLATLSHELRNPLAPILTGFEIMRMVDDPATIQRTRDTMERQTQQLVRLVDDLLDVSRITRGKLALQTRSVDVGRIMKDAVDAARPGIDERGHSLTVDLPDPPLTLEADAARMTQVLANLLNNAAMYTPPGGSIAIRALRNGGEVQISVADTGAGIADDMRVRVFEMFAQVERAHERGHTGLGVGLTLARSLVELHGGSIDVESPGLGLGSTFIVRLPLDLGLPLPTEQADLWDSPQATSVRRVLVVDDNEAFVESLSLVIEMLGHEVRTAVDGRSAFDAAAEFRPDVVLMDIGMPGMNGYEAARLIRDQSWGRHMTLVALTGWGQDEDKQRTRDAGFDHHLVKPAKPDELRRLLAV